jgi:HEAT repeat protein
MRSRVVFTASAVALTSATLAIAQVPGTPADGRGGGRLRDRYERPRQQQKLDDAIRKFGEEDVQSRLEGVEGLGENAEDPKAVEYLVRAAADADMSVRVKAIGVIGDAKVRAAVPILVQQLFMRDTTLPTKQYIVASLGKVGDPAATKPLLDLLARDVDPSLRGGIVYALGEIGDKNALPTLQKLVKDPAADDNFRGLTQAAIRKIEQKPARSEQPPALAQDRRLRPPDEGEDATP